MIEYCPICRRNVEVELSERDLTRHFAGLIFPFREIVAKCGSCGYELYIPQIQHTNYDLYVETYREACRKEKEKYDASLDGRKKLSLLFLSGYCKECNRRHLMDIHERPAKATVRGVTFSYDELYATCFQCGAEMYDSEINDINASRRAAAFSEKKGEIEHA